LLAERRGGLLRPGWRGLAVMTGGETLPWLPRRLGGGARRAGGLGRGSCSVAWELGRLSLAGVLFDLVRCAGGLRGEWRQRVQFRADLAEAGADLQERVG
jgi:hypothetical protein